MISGLVIFILSFALSVFITLFIIYFSESAQNLARTNDLEIQLKQADARAQAEEHKAAMARKVSEQANGRATMLAADKRDLKAENAALHERVLYLTGLIRAADAETIARMNVMVVPSVRLANDTINLN